MDINNVKIKILLLASNPKNTSSLRLTEEFRDIKESIKLSENSHDFDVFEGYAVRAKDLRRLILEKAPHIIHYSGHGEDEGILLENNQGNTNPVEGHVLEDLFSLFDSINCIILNSCYSVKQANSLKKVVPYIIGMQESIKDQSAIYFSTGFYDAIASKRTIEDAFKFGVNAIDLHENENLSISRSLDLKKITSKEHIPILIKGDIDRDFPNSKKSTGSSIKKQKSTSRIVTYFIIITIVSILVIIFSIEEIEEGKSTQEFSEAGSENNYPIPSQQKYPPSDKNRENFRNDFDKATKKILSEQNEKAEAILNH